ncbi:MAG: TetR/AcrR family transcriptional regulator [Streptosporangiaceae bacterium]
MEEIIRVATRLFAELGYDSTGLQTIADALGCDQATVLSLVTSKSELYLKVMGRAAEAEQAALGGLLTASPVDVPALADTYLDFCVAHPEVPALWMHRWMSDATDLVQLEALYVQPLHESVGRAISDQIAPDVDVDYAVWTIIWCVHGFLRGGVLTDRGPRGEGPSDADLAAFRAHLRLLVGRLTT